MKSALNEPHLTDENAAFEYVESKLWPNGPVCPHCGSVDQASRSTGKTTRAGLWNCRACRKPFTVSIGTIFESSHVPLHVWLQAIYLICSSKKGISTRQMQRTLGGSMKTAWFLMHRIREAMAEKRDIFTPPLGGGGKVLEADETFIQRDATRKLAGLGPVFPVFSLVERGGSVRSFHVANVDASNLHPILARHADAASRGRFRPGMLPPAGLGRLGERLTIPTNWSCASRTDDG